MKKIPDQTTEHYSAIIRGAEQDRLKDHGLVGDILTMLGFGVKGEKEKAVDALIRYEIAKGTRSGLGSIIWDDDTLIIENRLRKAFRWTPRVVLGGILVTFLACDPNIRSGVTKTFHTLKESVTTTFEDFIKNK